MADRLAALVASRDAFVADASHQLRTPLTALRLRLDLLEDVAGDDPEIGTELEAITDEVDRLSAMVEGLLELARTSGGDHRTVEVDLGAAATAAAARWGPLAAERGVEVNVAVADEGAVAVRAVDGAIEQILDNLVDNALEVSPSGSAIDIDVHRSGGDVASLEVRDRGPGLDPASRHRAFDRFWRAGDAAPGGSGLGLAIVAELARRSGGEVELTDPADGPGLLARVELPSWTPSGRSD
jgi:signal transduction histidine kinase